MRVDLSAPLPFTAVNPLEVAQPQRSLNQPPKPSAVQPPEEPQHKIVEANVSTGDTLDSNHEAKKQLEEVLKQLNSTVQRLEPHLEFSVAEGSSQIIVKLVDSTKNEVIRQYPSEAIIELSKRLDDLRGLLIRETA
jgi:flagellar protein FlaG